MEKFCVDRDDAPLTSLLERHDAVNGRQDAVAEELLAPLAQRVTLDADEFEQPVLERVGRQGKFGPQRHRGGHLGRLAIDAHRLR